MSISMYLHNSYISGYASKKNAIAMLFKRTDHASLNLVSAYASGFWSRLCRPGLCVAHSVQRSVFELSISTFDHTLQPSHSFLTDVLTFIPLVCAPNLPAIVLDGSTIRALQGAHNAVESRHDGLDELVKVLDADFVVGVGLDH